MIRRVLGLLRSSERDRPLVLDRAACERARFCFAGELGYEMISWIPYLNFLATCAGISVKTASRPGSAPFYYFSADHKDLEPRDIAGMWGEAQTYEELARRFPDETIVSPGPDAINKRQISIDGFDWEIKNIHSRLMARNYLAPDLTRFRNPLPIPANARVVVINNKYFTQWPSIYDQPVNFLAPEDLLALRELFYRHRYFVVYNHFVEETAVDQHLKLHDEEIFGKDGRSLDMRQIYQTAGSPQEWNELQLSLYNSAEFVVGPQGGNLYLPAFCRRPLYILMRAGDYIDYLELGRLCGVPVESFYEPRHLIHWLDCVTLTEST